MAGARAITTFPSSCITPRSLDTSECSPGAVGSLGLHTHASKRYLDVHALATTTRAAFSLAARAWLRGRGAPYTTRACDLPLRDACRDDPKAASGACRTHSKPQRRRADRPTAHPAARRPPPRRFDLEHRAMSDREVQSFLQMCYSFDIDCLVRGGADDSQQGSPCPEDSCIPLEVTCPRHQVRSPSVAERTKLYRYLEVRAAASPHSRLTLGSPSTHHHGHRAAVSHGHGPRCRRTWARVTIDRV